MSVAVCHGGDPIPKSPFHITVAPLLDLSKVCIQGLNSSEYLSKHAASTRNISQPPTCQLWTLSTKTRSGTAENKKEERRC